MKLLQNNTRNNINSNNQYNGILHKINKKFDALREFAFSGYIQKVILIPTKSGFRIYLKSHPELVSGSIVGKRFRVRHGMTVLLSTAPHAPLC